MDAIRLLSTGSFSSWLSGLSPTDYTGRSLDQVAAGLRREGELAAQAALLQRLRVEIGALQWLRDQMAAYRTAHGTLEGYAPAGPEDWGLTDRFTQGGAGFGSERVLAFVAWSGWLEALPAEQKAAGLEQALQRLQGVRTVLEGLDGTGGESGPAAGLPENDSWLSA
jgi:hypothetical protein